jgi:hypothetical protein
MIAALAQPRPNLAHRCGRRQHPLPTRGKPLVETDPGIFYGAGPDLGVLLDDDGGLIGMADYGGAGSVAGATGNGTLYRLELEE